MFKTLITLIILIKIQGVQWLSHLDHLDLVGKSSLSNYLVKSDARRIVSISTRLVTYKCDIVLFDKINIFLKSC